MKLYASRILGMLGLASIGLTQATSALAQELGDNRLPSVAVNVARIDAPARVDVSRTCPGYGEAMKDSVMRSLRVIDTAGEMKVSFQLKGDRVDTVQAKGGNFDYRRAVRRAVSSLGCVNDGQANQQYAFVVVFKPDDGSSDSQALAVVETPTVLARKD